MQVVVSAFSKYLAFNAGGAEVSTTSLLDEHSKKYGSKIRIISQDGVKFLGNELTRKVFPKSWDVLYIPGLVNLNRFSYYEYLVNKGRVAKWFAELDSDEIWSYGISAPAAIIGFQGKSKYFVRSETDLGLVNNYYTGSRRFAKAIYSTTEYPAKKAHQKDLMMAIERSTVIANSKYMASRTRELFGVTADVIYPSVDITLCKSQIQADPVAGRWVVFVGDSPVKGLRHVLAAAHHLPAVNFRIYSRFVQQLRQEENITWMPWEKDAWRIYRGAGLVIVPSQWEEAYGRVAREAYLLGIPVLVSNVGGLPEAVDEDQACLVDDFRNPDAWVRAIRNAIVMHQDLEFSQ